MSVYRIENFIGEDRATAAAVAEWLAFLDGAPAEIVVNSPGGDAFEGAAIYAELRAYRGDVVAHVRGIAASAASLLLMGADQIVMDRASVLMIHDPSGVTIGPAADHRRTAEDLEKLAGVYARAYAERSFNRPEDVRAWMLAETWLSAEEAVALGFADRIEEAATDRPSQEVVARARALWMAATSPKGEINGTA